jgi:cyclopropane fatty-acyl-phospholipid synthase-like methyltransferase
MKSALKRRESMNYNPEWWQKFYTGTWQHIQPFLHTPGQTRKEADFIEDVLDLKPPAGILDVPCGEGRLTIELASRGYKMNGVDLNKNFLKIAEKNANKQGLDITWRQGDMRKIPWKNEFGAVICMGASFGYLNEKGNLEFIKAVSRSLRNKGFFLLDTPVTETLYPKFKSQGTFKLAGVTVLVNRFFDHKTGRNEEDFAFIQKGKQTKYHSSIRIYTYIEVVNLLRQSGFGYFDAFGSLSKDAFGFGARRLLITARRV